MGVRIHPTALIENGVDIGDGSSIWDSVHVRGPGTKIGKSCIVGEKTYIAYGVEIGDLVKINAFVYICNAVTIETGVMISAGTTFTNDRFPRATTPDLSKLAPSEPDEHTLDTRVCAGATLGARCVIGPGITIGRFAMVGMGAVVSRSVPAHHLVIGSPAKSVAVVCRCGPPVARFEPGKPPSKLAAKCEACGRGYLIDGDEVTETLTPS